MDYEELIYKTIGYNGNDSMNNADLFFEEQPKKIAKKIETKEIGNIASNKKSVNDIVTNLNNECDFSNTHLISKKLLNKKYFGKR